MINKYDKAIKKAAAQFLPGIDWRLLKAQLQAESNLDPKAKSPAGAMGIAQFMPKTWEEVAGKLNFHHDTTPYDAPAAIIAAAYYMSTLLKQWTAKREETDRYFLALASYNAGFGNILDAQRYAGGVNDYFSIMQHLNSVTGNNAQETLDYIPRIYKTFGEYVMEGR